MKMIEFRFEKKEFEDQKDYAFRGLLFDEDTAYKFAYLVGSILDHNEVFVSIQTDEKDIERYSLKINHSLDDSLEDVSAHSSGCESD